MQPKVLRELSALTVESQCVIYRQSMETGILPKDGKMGHISPVFKKVTQKL